MQWTKRNLGSWFMANLLILGGYIRRAKERAMRGDYILSVYFHKPSKKEFEQCIRWLKKNNFAFLSTHDLADIIDGHLPFPKGGVLLTVDDGWQTNEENMFEVAERYGVPLTVFIPSRILFDICFHTPTMRHLFSAKDAPSKNPNRGTRNRSCSTSGVKYLGSLQKAKL